jgi:integrase
VSVYRTKSSLWTYDFWFKGRRYYPAVSLENRDDAAEAEQAHKKTLRRRAAGLESLSSADTPRFSDWAPVTLKFQKDRKRIKDPNAAKTTLRMILAFWGTKPRTNPVEAGEYRNLRLGDPIQRPELLLDFEAWMASRKLSGARKNHYRSACSMLYRVALLPENRTRTGVRENPFAGVLRDRVQRRTRVLSPAEIQQWIDVSPVPVVVAITLGTMLPGLRLKNIVDLTWANFSPDRAFVSVPHKADRETGLPLTLSVSAELKAFLKALRARRPKDPYVVPLDGERYWQLTKLIRRSLINSKLPYGRNREDGVTFHSLRHSMNTWLARRGVTKDERQRSMGHATSQMQDWYTHFGGADTVRPMKLIGRELPLAKQAADRLKRLESPGRLPVNQQIRRDSRVTVRRRKSR